MSKKQDFLCSAQGSHAHSKRARIRSSPREAEGAQAGSAAKDRQEARIRKIGKDHTPRGNNAPTQTNQDRRTPRVAGEQAP